MSEWEERMSARARARARRRTEDVDHLASVADDLASLRGLNAYRYPRRLAFVAREEACPERGEANCYEVRPDGDTGRWMAFHRGPLKDCTHAHHRDEIWLAG